MTESERLVEQYLVEVARACSGLPTAVRLELMADLREHITATLADLPRQTEAAVRGILGRLGEPRVIAAEARAAAPTAGLVGPVVAAPPMPMRRASGMPASSVAFVVLIPAGIVVAVLVLGALFALLPT